eukprot:jgi/Ulvmu1/554/UM001_0562.1
MGTKGSAGEVARSIVKNVPTVQVLKSRQPSIGQQLPHYTTFCTTVGKSPCMSRRGGEILTSESLFNIGKRCHELLSNRPELQTLLHANGTDRSLLVDLCVHGLLRSQVPASQLVQPKASTNQPHQHMTQRLWVFVGQAEVARVSEMSVKDLNTQVLNQLSLMREAYLNGGDMLPGTERLIFMQPTGPGTLPIHAPVPQQIWQHMHALHAVAQAASSRGQQVGCFYLHPLVCGTLDGVSGADMDRWARAAAGSISKLAILCVADIDQWRQESIAGVLGPGRGASDGSKAAPAPPELRGWLAAGNRPVVLQAALQNASTLLQDSHLAISHDVDFGQCSLSQTEPPAEDQHLMQQWLAQAPQLQAVPPSVLALPAWLSDAAAVATRVVMLTNKGAQPMLIVDLGVHPNTHGLFFILEQHGIWRHRRTEQHAPGDLECLELAPGASHSLTVLAKTPQVAGLPEIEALKLSGIFQSVLTAVVWTRAEPNADHRRRFPVGTDAAQLAWTPQERYSVDVVGCRVCITLTRSKESALAALRAARNAAPFIPRELRLAFCLLGWAAPSRPCPPELQWPYMTLKLKEPHVLSAVGVRVSAPIHAICVVSPMIPPELSVLDQAVTDVCGPMALGWEPDIGLGAVGSPAWHLLNRVLAAFAGGGGRVALSDTAALMHLSAAAHSLLVRGRTGIERQQASLELVQQPLQQARDVVDYLGFGVAPGVDRAVEHLQRMLTVEGLAMLQDSFTMDAVVDMHVAEFSDSAARHMRVLSALPGAGGAEVMRSRYRGPELKTLARETGMLAEDVSTGKCYLLAVKVPNMLENRPHVVYGSRVHVTYRNSPAEDVCLVLDQFQSWCIMSAPAWLCGAASKRFHMSCIPNHCGTSASLQQAILRFAIDRTPLQRMLVAAVLHSHLSHASAATPALLPGGLVPPRPADDTKADAYAEFHTVGRLPTDLFGSGAPASGPTWHHRCAAGPITGAKCAAVDDFHSSMQVLGPVELNAEQRRAVSAMCTVATGSKPLVLFGPPGTGKTVTLVEMVLHLMRSDGNRILVSAPQNFTCDTFCERLLAAGVPQANILRVIDPRWPASRVSETVMQCTLVDRNWAAFKLPTHAQLRAARIVIVTCTACALLMRYRGHLLRPPVPFTHALLDEAGQLPLTEALLPLLLLPRGPAGGAACLAGDPRQLGAQLRSPVATAGGLAESLLERLIAYYRGLPSSDAARGVLCTVLVCNYRSHEHLLRLPSRMFYGSALRACAPDAETVLPAWSLLSNDDGVERHTMLVPVHGEQLRLDESPALYNTQEAQAVTGLVNSLIQDQVRAPAGSEPVRPEHIGVICMSRAQAICVRNLLRQDSLHGVNVGTVDDFQGQEMRIIFITTVLTQPEVASSGTGENAAVVGFFNNPKRFNVAITRAKALLVIVGHPDMLKSDRQWGHLWRFCKSRRAIVGEVDEADELLGVIANLTLGAQAQEGLAQQVAPMEAFAVEQQVRVAV